MAIKILQLQGLKECKILERINRFVIEIESADGDIDYASTNNTGRLKEFLIPGKRGYCIPRNKPKKTRYRLIAIQDRDAGALIDTNLQMKSFEIALERNLIPWLRGYRVEKRNPKVRNSMLDYILKKGNEKIYVEIKSAVMRKNNFASYPDCPSERGKRHIKELIELAREEKRAMIVFISGLKGVDGFVPNVDVDPKIEEIIEVAINEGVKIKGISFYLDTKVNSIILENPDLPTYLYYKTP